MAMSIGSVGSVPASLASAKTGVAVAVSVLTKTLDIQQQTALQLLQALPAASAVRRHKRWEQSATTSTFSPDRFARPHSLVRQERRSSSPCHRSK